LIAICAQTLGLLDIFLLAMGCLLDSIPGGAAQGNFDYPKLRSRGCMRKAQPVPLRLANSGAVQNVIIRAQTKQFGAIGEMPGLAKLL
jgi:hypothetical protein